MAFVFKTLFTVCAFTCVLSIPVQHRNSQDEIAAATRHQYLKQIRIHSIKKEVIEKLRLDTNLLQNASKEIPRVVFRKALEKLKMKDRDLEQTGMIADAYAQISEIVSFSESDVSSPINAIHFHLADDVIDPILEVSEATVWVLLKYKKYTDRKSPARSVKLLARTLTGNKTGSVVAELETTVWHTRWQKLTLPPKIAQPLIEYEGETLSLVIECHYCDDQLQPVLARKTKPGKKRYRRIRLNKRRPFLIIHTRIKPYLLPPRPTDHTVFKRSIDAKRGEAVAMETKRVSKETTRLHKRSTWVPSPQDDARCNYTADEKSCRLIPMYVNLKEQFSELVAEPSGTYMNYCAGECGTEGECCQASSTLPLTLTYFHPDSQDGPRTVTINDLIITRCGCK